MTIDKFILAAYDMISILPYFLIYVAITHLVVFRRSWKQIFVRRFGTEEQRKALRVSDEKEFKRVLKSITESFRMKYKDRCGKCAGSRVWTCTLCNEMFSKMHEELTKDNDLKCPGCQSGVTPICNPPLASGEDVVEHIFRTTNELGIENSQFFGKL